MRVDNLRLRLALSFTLVGFVGCDKETKRTGPESAPQASGRAARVWKFDDLPAGRAPIGWRIMATHPSTKKELAVWQVMADPAAPSRPNVLTITKTENEGGTFNLAVVEGTAYKDVDLSVKLRANTGKEDQGGGLVWRLRDENNYYICRLNPLENNFRVYKVVDGKRTQFESTDSDARAGAWHTLRATMTGDKIVCYLDGQQRLQATDDTLKEPGMIGLWSKADAASSFDELTVSGE